MRAWVERGRGGWRFAPGKDTDPRQRLCEGPVLLPEAVGGAAEQDHWEAEAEEGDPRAGFRRAFPLVAGQGVEQPPRETERQDEGKATEYGSHQQPSPPDAACAVVNGHRSLRRPSRPGLRLGHYGTSAAGAGPRR
jgi:hypothetical protein